jgi:hypothetical protein
VQTSQRRSNNTELRRRFITQRYVIILLLLGAPTRLGFRRDGFETATSACDKNTGAGVVNNKNNK